MRKHKTAYCCVVWIVVCCKTLGRWLSSICTICGHCYWGGCTHSQAYTVKTLNLAGPSSPQDLKNKHLIWTLHDKPPHAHHIQILPQLNTLTTDNKAFRNKKRHCSLNDMPSTYFRQYHCKLVYLQRDYMQLPSITATSSLTLPHSFFANKLTLPFHCLPITIPNNRNTLCNPCGQTPHIPSLTNGNYQLHVHVKVLPLPETKIRIDRSLPYFSHKHSIQCSN